MPVSPLLPPSPLKPLSALHPATGWPRLSAVNQDEGKNISSGNPKHTMGSPNRQSDRGCQREARLSPHPTPLSRAQHP